MAKCLGLNHIDLGTKNMEATRAFYEDVLGFPLVRADLVELGNKGVMKHFFFDIGNGQLLGFMSGEDVEGYPKDFDSGINKGLGLMPGVYHFAFNCDSLESLEATQQQLQDHGVEVSGPVDHEGWSSRSTSKIRTVCSSNAATCCARSTRTTRFRSIRFRLERGVKLPPREEEGVRAAG